MWKGALAGLVLAFVGLLSVGIRGAWLVIGTAALSFPLSMATGVFLDKTTSLKLEKVQPPAPPGDRGRLIGP